MSTEKSTVLPYVDTHCHIDSILDRLKMHDPELLKELFPPGFEGALHVVCEKKTLAWAENNRHIPWLRFAAGIHPHDASQYDTALEERIRALVNNDPAFVAWGEIGLDYHYDNSPRDIQRKVFSRQLEVAQDCKKAIVLHTREAETDTLEILQEQLRPETRLHVHCFTSSREFAEQLLEMSENIFIGFTGILTFPSAESVCEAAAIVPLDRLLLETDSPWMAPVPHRGKPAHPGMIPLIARKLAEIKKVPEEKILGDCRANTRNFYGF